MKVTNVEKMKIYTLKLTEKELNIIIDLMCAVNNGGVEGLNDEESELCDSLIEVLNQKA
jgi:hypothetical protein